MKGGVAMRAVMCSVVIGAVSLAVMAPGALMAGTIEIPLRASDVVMSSENPPELILRVPAGQFSGRVDLIRVELVVDANDGEEAAFVPFLVSIGSVVPGGPSGYEPSEVRPAREMVLGPGSGQTILLDATRALRSAVSENEMYLQVRLVEPVESGRQPGTIGFPLQGGTLGRMLVVTR